MKTSYVTSSNLNSILEQYAYAYDKNSNIIGSQENLIETIRDEDSGQHQKVIRKIEKGL